MEIPFFSTLVGYLADLMRMALAFCYDLTEMFGFPSYGVAIIVLTLIIKIILLPLALKQIRSMKGMQELQPQIKALQKKYKNDKVKFQQEMQKLYKEKGVSPLAGCLPLLIQMPFLVSIFYALQGYPYDPAHESFLWLESLGQPDPTYVLPVLSALSTFVISWQTTPKSTEGAQKSMLYFMPLFIGYISLNFPSGLVIYWVVCNIFQFVQQCFMYRDETMKLLTASREGKGVVTVDSDEDRRNRKKAAPKKSVKKKAAQSKKDAAPEKDDFVEELERGRKALDEEEAKKKESAASKDSSQEGDVK